MSYAHSAFGGPARCYDHFAGFMNCMENAKHPYFCVLEREDYFECLHMARMRRRASVYGIEVEKDIQRKAAFASAQKELAKARGEQ
mmetsp:Transcript_51677/g.143068  ORF Transcript_51677/g.143068 Transcript_51677/m.143068 type:complete len:86 (+) Transcript_51677:143-400(+)